jgi:cell division septum initiation protein DivIVA
MVAEQVATIQGASAPADPAAESSALREVRRDLVNASSIRKTKLSTQSFGGYRKGEVDDLTERAAASLEALSRQVALLKSELDQARAAKAESDATITQMLVTAQRIVDRTKEDARNEAAELIKRAQDEVEAAERVREETQASRHEAEEKAAKIVAAARTAASALTENARREAASVTAAALAESDETLASARAEALRLTTSARADAYAATAAARAEAEQLRSSAEAERNKLIAESTHDALDARQRLEAELLGLTHKIDELRTSWRDELTGALAHLDAFESGDPASQGHDAPSEELANDLRKRAGAQQPNGSDEGGTDAPMDAGSAASHPEQDPDIVGGNS